MATSTSASASTSSATSSTTSTHFLSSMKASLGTEMVQKIQQSKILLVGAGGIGCELLKNLALTGFAHIHVVDLDTIDVSNLNRQLLFRSQHVGMPKCTVACQVATQMVPDPTAVDYIPLHGNVCDNTIFNVQFVSQFDLVLNALDNVTARRRVNRLTLAAGVPLVEAGTTGYLGQVNVIDKASNIACYECKTVETQKVYPICTIRSTPSMPVHTIVWAKEFYKLLFGVLEESMLFEDPAGEEPSTYMPAVMDFRASFATKTVQSSTAAATTILTRLFVDEIQKQLDMDRYKTASKTPEPLSVDILTIDSAVVAPTKRATYKTTDVWSQADCVAEIASCLADADPETVLPAFDKDCELSMRLVAAAANLRSYVFGIEPIQSYYSAKGIAGNIIPAIATTNAIAAGLQILQAFSILRMQLEKKTKTGHLKDYCRYVNCVRRHTRNGLYLTAPPLEGPNPNCFVCRNATIPLQLNLKNWTLQDLVDRVIKKNLGFQEPTIAIDGDIIWEEGDDCDEAAYKINLPKLLSELPCGGLAHGTVFSVEDFSQDMEVQVAITHQEVWELGKDEDEADEFKFVVRGAKPAVKAAVAAPVAAADAADANGESKPAAAAANVDDDDDDDCIVVDGDAPVENGVKRSADENGNGDAPAAKKLKTSNEVIEIE